MTPAQEKEAFVETEMSALLQKLNIGIKETWYDEEGGKEYVYIEFLDGTMRRVDVTGENCTALLLDVIHFLN